MKIDSLFLGLAVIMDEIGRGMESPGSLLTNNYNVADTVTTATDPTFALKWESVWCLVCNVEW